MQLTSKRLPTRKLSTVFHVGSLNPAHKSLRGESLEGSGLSVSVNPSDWIKIARLGGHPCWHLDKPTGLFLNFHQLGKAQTAALLQWGLENKYAEIRKQWVVGFIGSETDEIWTSQHETEPEARADYEDRIEDTDVGTSLEELNMPCHTQKMNDRLGFKSNRGGVVDMLATFWVEDKTTLDGVWWSDTMDPDNFSAPRGVINMKRLPEWQVS